MYKEEINNWWGDIPSGFDDLQKKARRALWEFEDAVSQLQEICESQDPEKVAGIAETLQDDWGRSVSALRDLFDEDFLRAVRLHKKRYQQLTETGLIGTHAAIRRLIKERFVKDLSKVMPVPRNQVYLLKVTYEPVEWRDVHVTSRFEVAQSLWPEGCKDTWGKPTDMPDSKGVLEGKPGAVEVYMLRLDTHTENGLMGNTSRRMLRGKSAFSGWPT